MHEDTKKRIIEESFNKEKKQIVLETLKHVISSGLPIEQLKILYYDIENIITSEDVFENIDNLI